MDLPVLLPLWAWRQLVALSRAEPGTSRQCSAILRPDPNIRRPLVLAAARRAVANLAARDGGDHGLRRDARRERQDRNDGWGAALRIDQDQWKTSRCVMWTQVDVFSLTEYCTRARYPTRRTVRLRLRERECDRVVCRAILVVVEHAQSGTKLLVSGYCTAYSSRLGRARKTGLRKAKPDLRRATASQRQRPDTSAGPLSTGHDVDRAAAVRGSYPHYTRTLIHPDPPTHLADAQYSTRAAQPSPRLHVHHA